MWPKPFLGSRLTANSSRVISRRRGIILVLVLLMLTLCGALAAQVSAHVVRLTARAALAEKELQQRWAVVSIRRSFLDHAPKLLTPREKSDNRRMRRLDEAIPLSRVRYRVTLFDETSKLPIHRMLKTFPAEDVKNVLRESARSRRQMVTVLPQNAVAWSEIFRRSPDRSPGESFDEMLASTEQVTLWSDGRLNLATCEAAALDALWRTRFRTGANGKLHDLRTYAPPDNLGGYLKGCELTETELEFAQQWLSLDSTTHSVWISESTPSGSGIQAVYVKRAKSGFVDEDFGFHDP